MSITTPRTDEFTACTIRRVMRREQGWHGLVHILDRTVSHRRTRSVTGLQEGVVRKHFTLSI